MPAPGRLRYLFAPPRPRGAGGVPGREYTTLGDTGLSVSRICIGCMSFGREREWFLDADASAAIVDRALDLGITFFDTANSYSAGDSERFLGRALADYDRERVVVATKGYYGAGEVPRNARGLSRKALDHQLAGSLDRLGMDTVDLYQTHAWDYDTPVTETLCALTDAVRRGDVRYLGASKTWAYQLAEALHESEARGLERFVSMQDLYNLVYREEEREVHPLCDREGVGVIPFSPLMRGYLARPADAESDTTRGRTDSDRRDRWSPDNEATPEIRSRVEEVAAEHGISMAQVAIAWLLSKDVVTAPIVGVTSVEHVEAAAEAVEVSLSASDVAYLEEPYEPVPVIGHQ